MLIVSDLQIWQASVALVFLVISVLCIRVKL